MASNKQTPAKKAYDLRYNRENRYAITIRLNRQTDADLIQTWESIDNKAAWFRNALRNAGSE